MTNCINPTLPHGGMFIDLCVDERRADTLKRIALNLPELLLNYRQLCDLELLATGVFSPLDGFMKRSDYESVLDRMRLQSDVLWPIPICLDIPDTLAQTLETGQSISLRDPEGFLLALLHIEEIWAVDKEKEASKIYGTLDREHPGIRYLFTTLNDYYIGGKLEVVNLPLHFDFKKLRRTPKEVREFYHKWVGNGWSGFKHDIPSIGYSLR